MYLNSVGHNVPTIRTGAVYNHEEGPITFFNGELADTSKDFSNLDEEFFAVVQAVTYWRHYLAPEDSEDSNLYSNLTPSKQTNEQPTLRPMAEVRDHKFGVRNCVPSRCHTPLSMTQVSVLGSKDEKELYGDYTVFVKLPEVCANTQERIFIFFERTEPRKFEKTIPLW